MFTEAAVGRFRPHVCNLFCVSLRSLREDQFTCAAFFFTCELWAVVVSQSQIVRGISLVSIAFSDADVSVVVGSLLNASVHESMRVFRKSVGEVGGGARGGLFMKDAPNLSSPSRGGLARFDTAAV